jgi:hypothetical protein
LFECFGDFCERRWIYASGSAGYADNQWLGHAKKVVLAEEERPTKHTKSTKCIAAKTNLRSLCFFFRRNNSRDKTPWRQGEFHIKKKALQSR